MRKSLVYCYQQATTMQKKEGRIMKKHFLRCASFLLAVLMAVPSIASCGGDTAGTTDTTPVTEAQTEVEALRDCIKAQMLERGTEEMQAGTYIIRWTSVLSNRFDSTAFKKEYAELYKEYTKQVASKRFSIA